MFGFKRRRILAAKKGSVYYKHSSGMRSQLAPGRGAQGWKKVRAKRNIYI